MKEEPKYFCDHFGWVNHCTCHNMVRRPVTRQQQVVANIAALMLFQRAKP